MRRDWSSTCALPISEIDYDKIDRIKGLDITFVTSAKSDEEGLELLKRLSFPFRQPAK